MTTVDAPVRNRLFGTSVRRVEDKRFITGLARYVGNIQLPGMLHVAFTRSDVPHGVLHDVDLEQALASPGVITAIAGRDIAGDCEPIRGDTRHENWQSAEQWPLAINRVRFAGEPLAAVVARNRYLAEDAAEVVLADIEPLAPVASIDAALAPGAPRLHEGWRDNVFVHREVEGGDVDAVFASAPRTLSLTCEVGRHTGVPMETRGIIAHSDPVDDRLTVWITHQQPHVIRSALAESLRLPEHKVRVIAPDIGGGFGIKCNLYPEDLVVCLLALRLQRPVKWIEDRREHLLAASHARDHRHEIDVAFTDDGIIQGVRARVWVDCGAYSISPWTAGMEPSNAISIIPGPYRIRHYRADGYALATNKCPGGPYRGVARVPAAFTIERAIDQVARECGLDPFEVRRRNMVRSEDFPYESITGKKYDSGSFIESLDELARTADIGRLRAWQAAERDRGRLIGVGVAAYIEQTAHGVQEYAMRRLPIVFGYDAATVRMDPSGRVTVLGGLHSHGQSLETTLAQIAADEVGVGIEDVRVVFGDTDMTPYGNGTFGSRSAVLCGGATELAARRVREKLIAVAAHLLGANADEIELGGGEARNGERAIPIAQLAHTCHLRPDLLPVGMDPIIEESATYAAEPGSGTFANGAHLAVVEVDRETGLTRVLRYVAVSDCGRMINPMVVDGQVHGGVCQGLGGALCEELAYDDAANPLSTTLLDYQMPNATDIPSIEVVHLETPSPFTRKGMKGVGEGGTIAPGAVIAAAVEDALLPVGRVFVSQTPLTPERVLSYVDEAERRTPPERP